MVCSTGGIAVGAVRSYPLQHFAVFVLHLVTSAAYCVFGFPFLLTVLAIPSVPAILQCPILIVFCDLWILSALFVLYVASQCVATNVKGHGWRKQWKYQWKTVD